MDNNKAKKFMQKYNEMLWKAETQALFKLSLKQPLSKEQFKHYKELVLGGIKQ